MEVRGSSNKGESRTDLQVEAERVSTLTAEVSQLLLGRNLSFFGVIPFSPILASTRMDEVQANLRAHFPEVERHTDVTVEDVSLLAQSQAVLHPTPCCSRPSAVSTLPALLLLKSLMEAADLRRTIVVTESWKLSLNSPKKYMPYLDLAYLNLAKS